MKKAFENRHVAKDFNQARELAKEFSGVGEVTIPFVSEIGPHKGKTVGRMSRDGVRGWRIDFDPDDPSKGFHINWWDRTGGKKRIVWLYGCVQIEGGTEEQFLALLQHAFGNVHDLGGEPS